MSQPNPEQQAMQQQQAMLQMQAVQAQIALNETQAKQNEAEAIKTMVETQLKPKEVEAKLASMLTQNLPNNADLASQEFDKRVKIAELMLKEADIKNKSKIVEMQMSERKGMQAKVENDFLEQLSKELGK